MKDSATRIKFCWETMSWQNITVDQVKIWECLYGDVDVPNEIKVKMIRWLDKWKGTKKVHKKNYARFIVNWLAREQAKAVFSDRWD